MRKLLIVIVVLVLLAVVVDVAARNVAEQRVARRLQRTFDLADEPSVSMRGTPFLLQLLRGDIPRIVMSTDDVRSEDVTLDDVEVEMRRVRFSPADVVDGSGRVTVAEGDGEAAITEASLNEALDASGAPFTVSLDGGDVIATAADAGIEATGSVSLEAGALSLGAEGLPSVTFDLPSLGGKVSYDRLAMEDGRATLGFSVARLQLNG
jgi:hypothetical protein